MATGWKVEQNLSEVRIRFTDLSDPTGLTVLARKCSLSTLLLSPSTCHLFQPATFFPNVLGPSGQGSQQQPSHLRREETNVDSSVDHAKVLGNTLPATGFDRVTVEPGKQVCSDPPGDFWADLPIPGRSKGCPMDFPTLPIGFQTGHPLEGPGTQFTHM